MEKGGGKMDDNLRKGQETTTTATFATAVGIMTTQAGQNEGENVEQGGMETIEVEQVLAAEMRQKVVEGDMIVPNLKPDIHQVVDVYVKDIKISSIDIICNKVIVRGELEVKVMYVANLPNEPVHAFEKKHIKFTRDIDVEGAMPGMQATADCNVEYIDYDFNDCEPRKVHVTLVLKFWTRVTTVTQMDVKVLSSLDGGCTTTSTSASMSASTMASAADLAQSSGTACQNAAVECQVQTPLPPFIQNVEVIQPEAGTSQSVSGMKGTVRANRVNLRTGPGTNYPSIQKLNKGDELTVKEQAFGWYKVVMNDGETTGWIASWFVNV